MVSSLDSVKQINVYLKDEKPILKILKKGKS
ncbi:hypothetical protein PRO82_002096 [Candidatus Protochlamydia amoebophila]|nr:hypothetical protein [Candidatus Protochlamydia amoebophila]